MIVENINSFEGDTRLMAMRAKNRKALSRACKNADLSVSNIYQWLVDPERSLRHNQLVKLNQALIVILEETE